jgi:hypothetical protein
LQHHTEKHQEPNTSLDYKAQDYIKDMPAASNIDKVVDDLIQPAQLPEYVLHQLKKNKKKKRKNISNNA